FAEEIGFSLFGKSGFQNPGTRAAESLGISECQRFCRAAGILFDRQERRCSSAFGENLADAMAGCLRSDHGDVHGCGWFGRADTDVEAVREHQCLAGLQTWLDGVAI